MTNEPIFLPKHEVSPHAFSPGMSHSQATERERGSTGASRPNVPPKRVFFAAMVFIFGLLFAGAAFVGFVPDYVDDTGAVSDEVALSELPQLGASAYERSDSQSNVPIALPERIEIPAIDMDLAIQNPSTKNIDKLTQVLVNGPARYVDSAKLGEKGNMLLFGHSSRLPVVRNQMYKAFNGISELKAGDVITVSGNGNEYLYVVTAVRIADAEEDVVSLSKDSTRLTLVTCNVLGEKTSRFIAEADFIGILPQSR